MPTTFPTATLDRQQELTRQLDVLVAKGYPKAARLSQRAFRALVEPLMIQLEALEPGGTAAEPVLAVATSLVPAQEQIAMTSLPTRSGSKAGFTSMEAADLAAWRPTADVVVPESPVWLVLGVDTGGDTLSVRPDDALPGILASGRSPLTLDEGLAVVTQHPAWLRERNCFEMLGSRAGDKRVTGLWVSAGRPRLGWCWGGNPHTWLGMATCERRVGPAVLD